MGLLRRDRMIRSNRIESWLIVRWITANKIIGIFWNGFLSIYIRYFMIIIIDIHSTRESVRKLEKFLIIARKYGRAVLQVHSFRNLHRLLPLAKS